MKRFLKRLAGVLVGLFILAGVVFTIGVLYPLVPPAPPGHTDELLIRNVHWLDLNSGVAVPDTDILVRNGDIIAVGPNLQSRASRIMDARGQYAIPGLFDMHVHSLRLAPLLTHPLLVAAGVTAVRDMGGCLGDYDGWVACAADKRRWDQAVRAGEMVGPRYDVVTSLAINGGMEIPSGWDAALGAATAGGARARVEHDANRGIDFLKPYSDLPRDGYFALAEAAQQRGLTLAGHKPVRISALEAVEAGQRSIEHAFLYIWECFPGAPRLREAGSVRDAYTHEMRLEMLEQHDPVLCAEIMAAMADRGMAYVPTHTTRRLDAYARDQGFRSDERLRYVPAPLRALWLADANSMADRTSDAGLASYRRFYEFGLTQSAVAHRAGVAVMAGTDTPDSFVFPGLSLHDELEHLVRGGMSPLDALRAATVVPANFLGLDDRAGIIRPGARADIVLLAANPLENINHVRQVQSVVVAGTLFDRESLDGLLAHTESVVGHWSMWPKFAWQVLRSPIFLAQAAD